MKARQPHFSIFSFCFIFRFEKNGQCFCARVCVCVYIVSGARAAVVDDWDVLGPRSTSASNVSQANDVLSAIQQHRNNIVRSPTVECYKSTTRFTLTRMCVCMCRWRPMAGTLSGRAAPRPPPPPWSRRAKSHKQQVRRCCVAVVCLSCVHLSCCVVSCWLQLRPTK